MAANPENTSGTTTQLLALIETIYAAVQQPSLWPLALEGIAEAVQGEMTVLFSQLPNDPLISYARTDESAINLYMDYYASVNVLGHRCDAIYPDGTVRYGDRAMSDNELEKTEFYNDFFKPHNVHYSFGLKVPLGDLPSAYLSCQRPKSQGPFQEQQGKVYEMLLPHLQRALLLYVQLTQMHSSVLGLESALDAFEHAVFGLNREGKVILANRQAEALVLPGDPLCLTNGVLSSAQPEQNHRLQALLADVVAVGSHIGISSGTSMLLERRSGENPLRVTVTPFSSPLRGSSVHLAALIFVSDSNSQPQSRGETLRALYSLTPAEVRFADSLFQGLEIREIANRLGLTLGTARFHVKRVLAKTGTRRQTELMRLMLSLPHI
ncbi:helix-turn-helix transcriptional regulator [Granulicella sp. WH15]|uniref:helix-turn-helix transcriptional regulator n=1 Tax=Granulicella sp. WH15 TaxID=2602070 RepID=UPI001366B878|nr:helix-turn-helix transcriptional regulator [Granulicella sp. WH15]QHN05124.1 helix-turn-helix transcriptional regulator [Granulicella sp. WH15]